jgi:NAD-dependent dihydropyrimidine dehydrogenase PreA subunit
LSDSLEEPVWFIILLGGSEMSILGGPRERFPWFPTINYEVCLSDLDCLNFCPAAVFDWEPRSGRPIVARPFDCIPGCRSCAENCRANGIALPGNKEVRAALVRIRTEDRIFAVLPRTE